ncbi:MAG: hypothetical protein M1815_006337 [Lichina confinis]|nr:MAG: hypothetical protein M1815_006337 [Lichina confinis]
MAIRVDIPGDRGCTVQMALIDSGAEDNFISQHTVQEMGLMPHGYTGVKTLDEHEMAAYGNHEIEYQIVDTVGNAW